MLKAGPELFAGIMLWPMVSGSKPEVIKGSVVLVCLIFFCLDWGERDRTDWELTALRAKRKGQPPIPTEMPSPGDDRERPPLLRERAALCCERSREDAIFDPLREGHSGDHRLWEETAVGAPELLFELILFTGRERTLKAERAPLFSERLEASLRDREELIRGRVRGDEAGLNASGGLEDWSVELKVGPAPRAPLEPLPPALRRLRQEPRQGERLALIEHLKEQRRGADGLDEPAL